MRASKSRGSDSPPTSLQSGLTPLENAQRLLAMVDYAIEYSQRRKKAFSRRSTTLRIAVLLMSGAATVILGLQSLTIWAGIGFSLVALTTVVQSLEQFFNWRSRWVLAEEAQAQMYRLRDDLRFAVATKAADELAIADLRSLFERYQDNWERFSRGWLAERRGGTSQP